MMTLDRPAAQLPGLTLDRVVALRDREWEERERAYHDTALDEVNSLVRKFNGMAPYSVRRGAYALGPELERAYRDSAEDIMGAISHRINHPGTTPIGTSSDEERAPGLGSGAVGEAPVRIRDMIREWIATWWK